MRIGNHVGCLPIVRSGFVMATIALSLYAKGSNEIEDEKLEVSL